MESVSTLVAFFELREVAGMESALAGSDARTKMDCRVDPR
jgi:hypothetical protein